MSKENINTISGPSHFICIDRYKITTFFQPSQVRCFNFFTWTQRTKMNHRCSSFNFCRFFFCYYWFISTNYNNIGYRIIYKNVYIYIYIYIYIYYFVCTVIRTAAHIFEQIYRTSYFNLNRFDLSLKKKVREWCFKRLFHRACIQTEIYCVVTQVRVACTTHRPLSCATASRFLFTYYYIIIVFLSLWCTAVLSS
jgi:hypothetical protein